MLCITNIQSLGSVLHKNSNCSYIKRYYYIPFILVYTVVKFGCTCFLTYCYSVRDSCRFISCPFPSHSTTPNLHTTKIGLLINPVNFIDNASSLENMEFKSYEICAAKHTQSQIQSSSAGTENKHSWGHFKMLTLATTFQKFLSYQHSKRCGFIKLMNLGRVTIIQNQKWENKCHMQWKNVNQYFEILNNITN